MPVASMFVLNLFFFCYLWPEFVEIAGNNLFHPIPGSGYFLLLANPLKTCKFFFSTLTEAKLHPNKLRHFCYGTSFVLQWLFLFCFTLKFSFMQYSPIGSCTYITNINSCNLLISSLILTYVKVYLDRYLMSQFSYTGGSFQRKKYITIYMQI